MLVFFSKKKLIQKGKRMLPKSFTWFDWVIDGDDGIVRDSECTPS
jgi:hypothetical protein